AAAAADAAAAAADLGAAELDVQRFESLLALNSGSRKQRDDAVSRRNIAGERRRAADQRVAAAEESVQRLRAGARREEVDGARARVAVAAAQGAIWKKAITDAVVTAPIAGVVTAAIADRGELVPPRAPLVVITDLDRAWASVYVDEPIIPRLRVGQSAALFPDGGGQSLSGTVSAIADTAEFTPRNVQTADDRSKLVFRVKISVDNTAGILKAGMPVEAEIVFGR
ncbi:MAG: HlyD family efflux transporter periplasmic adaptor subunit, partial [Vicinamibacterales bacterium]